MMRSILHLAFLGIFVVVFAGCDDGPEMYPVTGIIKLDGKPVEGAGVVFMPAGGQPAAGKTDAEGRYSLQTNDRPGAVAGPHKVTVIKSETIGPEQSDPNAPSLRRTIWHVPQRYGSPDASNLTAEVGAEQKEYNFDLKSR